MTVTQLPPGSTSVSTGRGYLHALNPLAKIAAPLPAMVVLLVARDVATPLAVLALGLIVLLSGTRLSARAALLLGVGLPAAVLVGTVGFGAWTDPSRVDRSVLLLEVGDYHLYLGSLAVGLATALRLAGLVVLALIGGLTTTGPDLVRSTTQSLQVPYRVAYTALAAFRFVPRFRRDLEHIRNAHRVRGTGGRRGPIAAVRRFSESVVPLLAGAIRHAERVAFAMEARAFGAHPTRTERHVVPLRKRDVFFTVLFWGATAAIVLAVPAATGR